MPEHNNYHVEIFADQISGFFSRGKMGRDAQFALDDAILDWAVSTVDDLDHFDDVEVEWTQEGEVYVDGEFVEHEEYIDMLYDLRGEVASWTNNEGPRSQILVLIEWGFRPSEIVDLVKCEPNLSPGDRAELFKLGKDADRLVSREGDRQR